MLLLNAFKSLPLAESWFTGSTYIRRTIADANLIEIHEKLSELLGKQL